jgi:hypothetical protein
MAALGVIGLIGAAGYGVYAFVTPGLTAGTDDTCHGKDDDGPISNQGRPMWRLKKSAGGEGAINISLADYVDTARKGTAFAEVAPTRRTGLRPGLPKNHPIRAFIRGGTLTDGDQSLGDTPEVTHRRAPDGSGVNVCVSTERLGDRNATAPGEYKGRVRVTGKRVQAVDLPVTVRVKAARTETALLALLVALISAGIVFLTQRHAPEGEEPADRKKRTQYKALGYLPLISGIIAGLVAALVVYADDPTWGAERGADTLKLVTATFAAAAAGLTATVPVARGAQRQVARKDNQAGRD